MSNLLIWAGRSWIWFLAINLVGVDAIWEEWWTYDGISGPLFWGLINPHWKLCNKGKRQSPINVDPKNLLYDPHLRYIHVDKHRIGGTLTNTGQSLIFRADKNAHHSINVTDGPLSYKFQFEEMYIHYSTDQDLPGSEHKIQGNSFPVEIQLYGFNSDLYHNMSEARHKSQGIMGISIMVQIGDVPNPELRLISSVFAKVTYRGDSVVIRHLSLRELLPNTEQYMTYEGSTTHPGCWETCTWILFNKPIYITRQQIYLLRKLMQGEKDLPKAPLGNNIRPLQPLHHRTIRTNIDFNKKECSKSMHKEMYYKANIWQSP